MSPAAPARTVCGMPLPLGEARATAGLTSALIRARLPSVGKRTLEIEGESGVFDPWGRTRALVLGAGGIPGLAWQASAVARLQREGTLSPNLDDFLIVGTSAGALMAALLRCGLKGQDVARLISSGVLAHGEREVRLPRSLRVPNEAKSPSEAGPWWRSPLESLVGPLPSGSTLLDELTAAVDDLWRWEDSSRSWPAAPTWLVATRIPSARRTVFGTGGGQPHTTLGTAVAASCAVPLLLPAVAIDGQQFTDGALSSISSVDLAIRAGVQEIVVVDPVAGHASRLDLHPRSLLTHAVRSWHAHSLAEQLASAMRMGIATHLVTPSPEELEAMGTSLLDFSRVDQILAAGACADA